MRASTVFTLFFFAFDVALCLPSQLPVYYALVSRGERAYLMRGYLGNSF